MRENSPTLGAVPVPTVSPSVIRSVNVGSITELIGRRGRPLRTGIVKTPVVEIEVREPGARKGARPGVVGDAIGSRRHHGGTYQAVYAVAREELDHWSAELGRDLPDGMFGENLTTVGLDVDAAVVGERWRIGADADGSGVKLEVTGPRVPCATFTSHLGEPGWMRRFADRGRTGAYLRVIVPGTIRPGDRIEVTDRPAHGITVPTMFAAVMGDPAARDRVLDAGCVADPVEREKLVRAASRS